MLTIDYNSDLPEKIEALKKLGWAFYGARGSALSSTGYHLMGAVREWIEKEGEGTWPPAHPATVAFRSSHPLGKPTWKSRRFGGAYHELGKFARYRISWWNSRLEIGFGTFSARDMRRGKSARFSRLLQKIAHKAQRGKKTRVTAKMRRKFGATRRSRRDVPGQDFFPLTSALEVLEVPPRPIMEPVFQRERAAATTVFRKKYYRAIKKRFERL